MNNNLNDNTIILSDSVIKCFANPKHFEAELFAYQLGLNMLPKLLEFKKPNWIKLEKVTGIPYLNALECFKPVLLAETLARFHLATLKNDQCLCHIDNSPKNILFCQDKYYFIDFSDSKMDFPERDITHLLLFWAADFSAKFFLDSVTIFWAIYTSFLQLDKNRWNDCLQQNIAIFDQRRELYGKPTGKQSAAIQNSNRLYLSSIF